MRRNKRNTNFPRDHTGGTGRRFYAIDKQPDGTVDVYLAPIVAAYDIDIGIREYDMNVRVMRGVVPWPGMEADIRARYDAWCKEAEEIDL